MDVEVVPGLGELGVPVVERALAGLGGVVAGSVAAQVGDGAVALLEGGLEVREGVGGRVGRGDGLGGEPLPGRGLFVVVDGGLKEVDDLFVFLVLGAVAFHVKGAEAGCVLGELVGPEDPVGSVLGDPEPRVTGSFVRLCFFIDRQGCFSHQRGFLLLHVLEKIKSLKGLDKLIQRGAGPGGDRSAVCLSGGGVGGRGRVVLTAEVAVLGVRAVAEVGPQTVNSPRVGGQLLALGFKTSVSIPELSRQYKSTKSFGAASVDLVGVCSARARQDGFDCEA